MIDVAGHKSERRKWIHVLPDVDSMLFVVDLGGYDRPMLEDPNTVRALSPSPLLHISTLFSRA